MYHRFIILLLLLIISNITSKAATSIIACNHAPTEENPCDENGLNYLQYLDTIHSNGNSIQLEKSLYYILTGLNEIKTNAVVFKLYQTIDAKKYEYKLIKEIEVAVKKDWEFCWAKFVFDQPNDYWIRAYKNDVLIDEDFVSINLRK
jgi:hypothetical protein